MPTEDKPEPMLHRAEICFLQNLRIDNSDEALVLIPTLQQKLDRGAMTQEELDRFLEEIKKFQRKD